MLSAESRKYFRNAFLMSGTIHNYFALSEENNQLKRAFEIAEELGEPKTSVEQLIAFLKNAPLKKLVNYSVCNPSNGLLFCEFLPVIESMVWHLNVYFSRSKLFHLPFFFFLYILQHFLPQIQDEMQNGHFLLRQLMKYTKIRTLMLMHGSVLRLMYVKCVEFHEFLLIIFFKYFFL